MTNIINTRAIPKPPETRSFLSGKNDELDKTDIATCFSAINPLHTTASASTRTDCSSMALSIDAEPSPKTAMTAKRIRDVFPTPRHMHDFAQRHPIHPNQLANLYNLGFYGPGGDTTCWKFHRTLENAHPNRAKSLILRMMPFHMPEDMRGALVRKYFTSGKELVHMMVSLDINPIDAIQFLSAAHIKDDPVWHYSADKYSNLLVAAAKQRNEIELRKLRLLWQQNQPLLGVQQEHQILLWN